MLSMINQMQLILILPLIGVPVPDIFIDFNRMIDFCLLAFSPITEGFTSWFLDSMKQYKYTQNHLYLYLIELETPSTLYNLIGPISMLILIVLVHIVLYFTNDLTLQPKGTSNFMRFVHTTVNYFTYGIYLRLFLLSYLFLLLTSFVEMRDGSENKQHAFSYSVACLVFTFVLGTTIAMFVKWLRTTNLQESSDMKYTKEMFNALKPTKLARSFYPMF